MKFDPRITVLMGENDVGKSAIVRALSWVMFNRPRGTDHIRHGTERCSVTLRTKSHKITRTRSKSENSYTLDGKKFKAFGNEVPKEIQRVLKVSDLNVQEQIDSPLWFTLSPGEVAKRLNSVVDLSVIDSTLSNLSTGIRRAKGERDVILDRIDKAREEKKSLRHVRRMNRELRRLEGMGECLDASRDRLTGLLDALHEAKRAKESLQTLSSVRIQATGFKALEKLSKRAERSQERQDTLERLLEEAEEAQKEFHTASKEAKKLHKTLDKKMGEACPMCGRAA